MATTHTVVKGDTLWGIAERYLGSGSKYKQLAAINNISNPSLIYVGQVIKLTDSDESGGGSSGEPDGGGSSGGETGGGGSSDINLSYAISSSRATITQFGLQSNTENTLFAVWSWNEDNTDNYEVIWYYDSGNGHWFVGSDSSTKHKESTYTIPSNAKRVKFKVKPISETYTYNGKATSYWVASWSTEKTYNVSESPPDKPSVPSVKIEKYKLTAELNNIGERTTSIQFQIIKNDSTVFDTGTATVRTSHASYSCNVDAGGKYKVRCRAYGNYEYSDWTEYSDNISTIPSVPTGITKCRSTSETSVYLEWSSVSTAVSYDIEYTTEKRYFDSSSETRTQTGIENTNYELTGLATGDEYFFRVRAVNDSGSSGWSDIKSLVIGKNPSAPTTWSSTTTAVTGELLTLYWIHNSEDGSKQTYAELEITVNGNLRTHTIKSPENDDDQNITSFYEIDTSTYTEGTKIQWRVRTAGVTKAYGDWSIQRIVDVYAPPTLTIRLDDAKANAIETLTSFPFYIYALAGPNTQIPIGYHLTISSNSIYETIDSVGNVKMVNSGEAVYSKYFDISESLLVEFTPGNIDLENNIGYTVSCVATMNSGLTVEASTTFTVAWEDMRYRPNASISLDRDILAAYIRPYCETTTITNFKVEYVNGVYTRTTETLNSVWGEPIDGVKTSTNDIVYSGVTADGTELYFCKVKNSTLVDGVSLSVYRREFDGSFTELATGLDNSKNTFITDPHPSLDYARYRIVAVTNSTGSVGYYDVPGYPINEPSAVIQWDEKWTSFDANDDTSEQPPWSGSLLKLPFNLDVSEKSDQDKSLIEYIGRKHPVSYYGTHVGETQSWKLDVIKSDKETVYSLRRLVKWMGDVYVREPSGLGYWATVSVSFSQAHCELTIPVSIEITRVEGGI